MLVDVWRTVTSVGEYRQKGHKKGLLGNVPFHDQGAGDMGVFSWRKFSHLYNYGMCTFLYRCISKPFRRIYYILINT